MWYIDQNHDTLVKRGHRVPDILCQFSGFRHPEQQKKRKIDSSFLKQDELKEHGSALYNLALASYLQKGSSRIEELFPDFPISPKNQR